MENERANPGSSEDIVAAPGDPIEAARLAVEQYFASQRKGAPSAAPASAPATEPKRFANATAMNAASKSAPREEPLFTGSEPESHEATLKAIVGSDFDKPFVKMSQDAAVSILKAKWNDDTDRRLQVVRDLTSTMGDEFRDYLDKSGRGDDPATILALYEYAIAQEESPSSGGPHTLTLPSLPLNLVPDDHEEQMQEFSDAARAAGLDGRTQQRLLNELVNAELDTPYRGEYELADAAREMESRWGSDYARRIAVVKRTVQNLGPEFVEYLKSSNQGNNPAALEVIYRHGSGELSVSKADAQKRLDKIYADPKAAIWNKGLGQHEQRRATAEIRFLQSVISEDGVPAAENTRTTDIAASVRAEEARVQKRSAADTEAGELLAEMKKGGAAAEAANKRWIELVARIA